MIVTKSLFGNISVNKIIASMENLGIEIISFEEFDWPSNIFSAKIQKYNSEILILYLENKGLKIEYNNYINIKENQKILIQLDNKKNIIFSLSSILNLNLFEKFFNKPFKLTVDLPKRLEKDCFFFIKNPINRPDLNYANFLTKEIRKVLGLKPDFIRSNYFDLVKSLNSVDFSDYRPNDTLDCWIPINWEYIKDIFNQKDISVHEFSSPIINKLTLVGFSFQNNFSELKAPYWRSDIIDEGSFIDEIATLLTMDNIKENDSWSFVLYKDQIINKEYLCLNTIKTFLKHLGFLFLEVNSVKKYTTLETNSLNDLIYAMEQNLSHKRELFNIFEIKKISGLHNHHWFLNIIFLKNNKEEFLSIIKKLSHLISNKLWDGLEMVSNNNINNSEYIYASMKINPSLYEDFKYQYIFDSKYPISEKDISLIYKNPEYTTQIISAIKQTPFCIDCYLAEIYEPKNSYLFKITFQSENKTLEKEDIENSMNLIYKELSFLDVTIR